MHQMRRSGTKFLAADSPTSRLPFRAMVVRWQLECTGLSMRYSRCDPAASLCAMAVFTITPGLAAERPAERVTWPEVGFATKGATITLVDAGTEIQAKVLSVEPQALIMDVTKTSNSSAVAKGKASIARSSISTIHIRKCGAKWRAILGIGLPAGLMGAAGAAINAQSPAVTGQEAAGVVFGVGAGSAVAGYLIGQKLDCHISDIIVVPESANSPASRRE